DKPRSVADWAALSDDQRKMYARQAEVFAGFVEFTDYEVGRLLDAIEELGVLDDTLVIYIAGDNGTSSEGNHTGNWNWMNMSNGRQETIEEQLEYYDAWGGPTTYPHMSVGWAIAFDAPFAYAKQVASDFGGTRNGAVVHWPNGFKARGELREQFTHVIDIAPTILQATGIPEPEYVNGVKQIPMQGTSIAYSFDHADMAERHTVQYFEVVGNRGIYADGWLARVVVKAPWELKKRHEVTDDAGWQLYDTRADFSLSNDLADQEPERLAAMKQQFLEEAIANHVLPLDDRLLERLLPQIAGRKSLMAGRTSIKLYPGTFGINENAFIDVKNRSSRTTAEVSVTDRYNNQGVLIAQGGRFGGWAIFIEDGRPGYVYNNLGELTVLQSNQMLAEGSHQISVDIDYDGNGLGNGANISLEINGKSVASARLETTVLSRFSFDEGADIAKDRATPVLMRNIGPERRSAYTGDLAHVTIEVQ
ncbi:MAG: sulfatase-like hydrolase/transferase, partial [Arenicellales bacterium]